MDDPKNSVLMAVIGAAHGIKGEVRVRSFTDDPLALAGYPRSSTGPAALRSSARAFRKTSSSPGSEVLTNERRPRR